MERSIHGRVPAGPNRTNENARRYWGNIADVGAPETYADGFFLGSVIHFHSDSQEIRASKTI